MYERYLRPDELMHYGVLGMKWGVRHDPQKASDKAYQKLEKIDKKIQRIAGSSRYRRNVMKFKKAEMKEAKYAYKRRANRQNKWERKLNKAKSKVYKSEYKMMKLATKGGKWVNKMNKILGPTSAKATPQQLELGKKYAQAFITYNGTVIPILK